MHPLRGDKGKGNVRALRFVDRAIINSIIFLHRFPTIFCVSAIANKINFGTSNSEGERENIIGNICAQQRQVATRFFARARIKCIKGHARRYIREPFVLDETFESISNNLRDGRDQFHDVKAFIFMPP